jgi:poly-gamma-glutamate synthesis protein (capsule biosynthesis protein)
MSALLALAGDTMLGRGVAETILVDGPLPVIGPRLREVLAGADALVLNLECCISERGEPWPAPGKRYFFRAPPAAVDLLTSIGTRCVTLANNHALDFGVEALEDTLDHLLSAGITVVGAGRDVPSARAAAVLDVGGTEVAVLGLTDHPPDFAAGPSTPGVAFADLYERVPDWLLAAVAAARRDSSCVLVTPHWGPNMVRGPVRHVRRAADVLVSAGATLVAGHSAHVFHGVEGRVLFDLGELVDDYAVHPLLRNDLGLLWLVHLEPEGPRRVEVVPLRLRPGRTEVAEGADAAWVRRRFSSACGTLGTHVRSGATGRLEVDLPGPARPSALER